MMSIIKIQVSLAAAAVLVCLPARRAGAEEPTEIVSRIVSSWRTRQDAARSLVCRARVDSFYPKGSLSQELQLRADRGRIVPAYPANDVRYQNETAGWTIDFVGKPRVRKEFCVTNPFYTESTCVLQTDCQIHLFVDDKYRLFRPRDQNAWMGDENKRQRPDVFLYEDQSNGFMLDFSELPISWIVGGVTGQQVFPSDIKRLEPAGQFTYRSEVERGNTRCVVLTTREQQATTIVREFWVDSRPPYAIRLCRARQGETAHWQIEATYRDGEYTPTTWTYTQYNRPDYKQFTTKTFRIEQLIVNQPIQDHTFDNTLKEGMVVFDVARNDAFLADQDGALTVYREETSRLGRMVRYGLGVTAGVLGLVLLWLWRRSRHRAAA